jgi:hypothetical protein
MDKYTITTDREVLTVNGIVKSDEVEIKIKKGNSLFVSQITIDVEAIEPLIEALKKYWNGHNN